MTREKRTTLIVLIILILLLVLGWILWVVFGGDSTPANVVIEEEIEQVKDDAPPKRVTVSEQELEEEREERVASTDVISLSKTVVARYGSYSNESDFQNLIDVLPLMSAGFAEQTQAFIDGAQIPDEYYGVSTRVITVDVEAQDDVLGVAQVRVTTQREEAIGGILARTKYATWQHVGILREASIG